MTEQRILMGAIIALAFSLLLNACGIAGYLKQRDALAQTRAQLQAARDDSTTARAAASACSAAVEDLQTTATRLAGERDTARAAAAAKANGHSTRADAVLAAPAPVPGDACASAAARFAGWQQLRGGGAP